MLGMNRVEGAEVSGGVRASRGTVGPRTPAGIISGWSPGGPDGRGGWRPDASEVVQETLVCTQS